MTWQGVQALVDEFRERLIVHVTTSPDLRRMLLEGGRYSVTRTFFNMGVRFEATVDLTADDFNILDLMATLEEPSAGPT